MLEKALLDLLVCPETKDPLIYKSTLNELWSISAGLAYPVRDGIPVLIAEHARNLSKVELEELNAS